MTLRTRLSLVVAVALFASGAGIGVVTAWLGRRAALDDVDRTLATIVAPATDGAGAAASGGRDPVDVALGLAEAGSFTLGAALYFEGEDPVSLLEAELPTLDDAALADAVAAPRTRSDAQTWRIAAVELDEGRWLLVGHPIDDVVRRYRATVGLALAAAALVALGAAGAVAWLIARALAPVAGATRAAERIGAGELDLDMPPASGAPEVGRLLSALRAMRARLRAAADERARSEARMRGFLGDVAHELRSPLTVVTGYADLLAGDHPADARPGQMGAAPARPDSMGAAPARPLDGETRRRAVDWIARESRRMSALLDDLLTLAQTDLVDVSRSDTVRIDALLGPHVERWAAAHPRVTVESSLAPLEATVNAGHLERLMVNLLDNVTHHAPGASRVAVSLAAADRAAAEGGGALTLVVEDDGPGFDAAWLAGRGASAADRARDDLSARHGRGLAIVEAIAHLHRGSMRLGRGALGGARVEVTLPA